MKAHADGGNSLHERHERRWCGGRKSSIFCGLMFLALGFIWLGNRTGIISLDMSLFWPSIMVIAGAWMLTASALRRKRSSLPE